MAAHYLPNVWLVSNGEYWMARWTDRHGKRQSKSLGAKSKISKREGTRLCRNIAVKLATGEIADGSSRAPRLGHYIETYIRLRPDLSKMTVYQVRNTGSYLLAFFGEDRRIDKIDREDALEWHAALSAGQLFEARKIELKTRATKKISPSTIAKHARTAKTMFGFAVDELEYISRNPFSRLKSKAPPPSKTWAEISRDDLARILTACPNEGWRAAFSLCRLAGLRRGEALRLEWRDVLFDRNKLVINARLEKETTKQARRECPIEFGKLPPGLFAELQRIHSLGLGDRVCAGLTEHNIDKDAKAILRSSVGVYAKPFHTLRKCLENELAAKYPPHVVTAWVGHSVEVANRHYLRVSEDEYARPEAGAKNRAKDVSGNPG